MLLSPYLDKAYPFVKCRHKPNDYKLRTVQMHSTDVQVWGSTCEGVICCACLQQSLTMWQPISFTTKVSINLSSLINLFPIQQPLDSGSGRLAADTSVYGSVKGPDWLAILLCRVCTGSTGEMGQSKTRPKGWIWSSSSSPSAFKMDPAEKQMWIIWSNLMPRLEWGLKKWSAISRINLFSFCT